ncbi:MAG: c-type cytochrome [Alphaproteobacteria bacterium]|nr:c-type cytochrome [Alphaproteobacteria bacterium]
MHRHRRTSVLVLAIAIVLAAGAVIVYRAVVPGLSSARREPPAIEAAIATWLLRASVPPIDRTRVNPLANDAAAIAAGQTLFREKCEICHAYDGSGKTEIGAGEYPRPPALRSLNVVALTDGEMFYHIRNGIRNTGMPAWSMPDEQLWQLVAYLRHLPNVAPLSPGAADDVAVNDAHYVGSAACRRCHTAIYDRWKQTRMANVVRDPREHPDAIIPDLSKPDPLVTFTKDDIAFVYGSKWKQRYFKRVGDGFVPLSAQWDVTHKIWRKYFVPNGADWWVPFYPADNARRPTGPLCDGCHSVNYNITTKAVTEWNVGCERCHGPGSAHVAKPVGGTIINPARLDYVHANDTCIQCHSQGRPLRNPIDGAYYDWPVGFHVGLNLADFWMLEEHKLGETTFTHFADGTAHKNRMQGNDFVTSLMYARGVTCFSCHDPHGSGNEAMLRRPGNSLCLGCHGPNAQNGPHAATIEAHTHHKAGSAGSQCAACHMPKIEQTIADVNVSSHTFRFVYPAETESLKIPNACNICHADKSAAWATAALRRWNDRSPWRVGD